MKSLFISLFLLFNLSYPLLAQQITATLSGNTSSESFSVLNNSLLNLFSVRGNGNVGIGTTSPTFKLDLVGGDARINGLTIGHGGSLISTNVAIGEQSLVSNTTGLNNTAVGQMALFLNTTGSYNTAAGFNSLFFNVSGVNNTAFGNLSLLHNLIGNHNTATGHQSLLNNTSGYHNVAMGVNALYSNSTADGNSSIGNNSMYSNTTGNYNSALGMNALHDNTTGSYNAALGEWAGENNTDISYGTFVGSYSSATINNLTNVSGFGYDVHPTASNQVRIGNASVTSVGGYAGWTNLSDERYKLNVQENVKGLDFIMKLRPVTYQLNMSKLAADLNEDQRKDENGEIINSPSEIDINSRNEKSQIVYTGFIAQEVEKVSKELGFDFSGIDSPKNDNDFYGLRYAEFVVPLVKAVQEQQKIIEELTRKMGGVYYAVKNNEFPQMVFSDGKQIGVTVQEIEKVYPELVKTDKDIYKTIDYTKLTALLIAEVKERQQIIEKQDKVIKDMNQRLEKIEGMMDRKAIVLR